MGRDKDSLIDKAKAMHTSKAKQGVNSPLAMGTQVFIHRQESRAPSHVIGMWEEKFHHLKNSLLLPTALYPEHDAIRYGMSLVSWDQQSKLCPIPASGAPQPTC